jgi:tetratricopeptide (TPR) repeat protein/DNA-binding CsgD family transcriptional regulator
MIRLLIITWTVLFQLGVLAGQQTHSLPDNAWEQEIGLQRSRVIRALEDSRDSSQIASELIALGNLYTRLDLFAEAMVQLNQAFLYLHKGPTDSLRIQHAASMARVFIGMEKYERASQILDEVLKAPSFGGTTPGLEQVYGLLGVCAEKQGAYLKALEYQKKSLELYQMEMDTLGESMVQEHIGSIYEDIGQYDLAYDHFQKAYTYLKGTSRPETVNLLNNLGDIHRKLGHYSEAKSFTQRALDLAGILGDKHQQESAHKDLSKIYAAIGDFQKAYKHLNQANHYREEALAAQNASQVNVLQTLYETDKKESEIRLLREQNKMNQSNQRMLGISAAAMLGLFLMAIFLNSRKKKAEQKIQELREKSLTEELDRSSGKVEKLDRELKLKTAALTRYSLNLSHKNKLLMDIARSLDQITSRKQMDHSEKLRTVVQEIDHNLNQDTEWDEFMNIFEEIHPEFTKKLNALANGPLSPAEMRLGMLLRMNLSSKEIASILRVTPDSVRVARYRLRKKLPIGHKKELVNFMVEL